MKVSKFWSVGVGATFLNTFHFSTYTFSESSDDFPSILNALKRFDDPSKSSSVVIPPSTPVARGDPYEKKIF